MQDSADTRELVSRFAEVTGMYIQDRGMVWAYMSRK